MESLQSVFDCTEGVLCEAGVTFGQLGGFYFAQGPGSLLGLRIAAMAVQGWRSMGGLGALPCLSYFSLHAAGAVLARQVSGAFRVCADYREKQWHYVTVEETGVPGPLSLVDRAVIESSHLPVYFVPQRQREQPLPVNAIVWNYDLADLPQVLQIIAMAPCMPPPRALPIYEPAPTTFVKWDGNRHRVDAPLR